MLQIVLPTLFSVAFAASDLAPSEFDSTMYSFMLKIIDILSYKNLEIWETSSKTSCFKTKVSEMRFIIASWLTYLAEYTTFSFLSEVT